MATQPPAEFIYSSHVSKIYDRCRGRYSAIYMYDSSDFTLRELAQEVSRRCCMLKDNGYIF